MVMYNHHERNMWGSGGYNVGSLDDDLEKFTAAVQKVMAYARELRDLGEQDEDDKLKSKLGISKEGEMMGLEHTFLVTVHALSATVIQTHDSIGRIEEVPAEEELDTDELFDALSNIYTNVEKFFVIIKSISPPNTNSDREDDDDDEVIDLTSSNDNEMEEQKKGWTLVAAYDFGGHEPSEHATQFLRPSEELAIVLQNARKAEAW